jgi:hypothetical protein
MSTNCDKCGVANPADIHTCGAKSDPYASEAESRALLAPDTRTPAEKHVDSLLESLGASDQGVEPEGRFNLLRQIAVGLIDSATVTSDADGSFNQKFTGLPLRKLRTLPSEGWAVNGVSIERQGLGGVPGRGAVTTGGMVLWWHETEGSATCTWTKSPDPHMPDTFNATCGVVWTFSDGGPAENDVRFCPGCGAAVSVADPEPEADPHDLAVKADNGGQP